MEGYALCVVCWVVTDNVYSERRHPVQQYKDVEKFSHWKEIVNEQPLIPVIPEPSSSKALDEVPDIANLCQERGVHLVHYLLAKVIRSNNNPIKSPYKWSYHNIFKLLPNKCKQWENACCEKLDMLQKHKVYKVVDHLKDQKVIWNQWVFDAKPDRWKKACLVVKGFS